MMSKRLRKFFFKNRKHILQACGFILIVFFVYFPAFSSYFQQDEWFFMAYYNQFHGLFWPLFAFIAPFVDLPTFSFHFTPLGSFLYGAEFRFFWIHYKLYILTSLIFHGLNCYLIYRFVLCVSKSNLVALISSLFFAFSSSILEATFWVGAHIQVQLALTFYLMSILLFIGSVDSAKKKMYWVSIVFFILSISTKETVALLVFSIPFIVLLYKDKKYLLNIKSFYAVFAVYIALRLTYPIAFKLITNQSVYSGVNNHSSDPLFIFYFSVSLFLKAAAQIIFSGIDFTYLSEILTDLAYSQYTSQKTVRGIEYLTFTQSAAHDVVLYILSVPALLIGMAVIMRFYYAGKKQFIIILYAVVVFILGVLPLTVLSGWLLTFFTYISSIESRQLYISAFGMSIIIGFFFLWIKRVGDKYRIFTLGSGSLVVIVLFGSWLIWQKNVIAQQIEKANLYANDRREIVNIWLDEKKKLDDRTIFYSESNVALYGFADYMLPLQNNPGQVIMSVYGHYQSLPKEFLTTKSLSKGLTEQWYEEHGGLGVGYFLRKKELIKTILDKNINLDNVISVRYDGNNHQVVNISQDIRAEMKTMLDQKGEIREWKEYLNTKYNFKFYYPQKYILEEIKEVSNLLKINIIDPVNNKLFIQIEIYDKRESEGVSDKALSLTGSSEYFVKSLKVGYTSEYTAILIEKGEVETYYFSTITNKEMKAISMLKDEYLDHSEKMDRERFMRFIEFYN